MDPLVHLPSEARKIAMHWDVQDQNKRGKIRENINGIDCLNIIHGDPHSQYKSTDEVYEHIRKVVKNMAVNRWTDFSDETRRQEVKVRIEWKIISRCLVTCVPGAPISWIRGEAGKRKFDQGPNGRSATAQPGRQRAKGTGAVDTEGDGDRENVDSRYALARRHGAIVRQADGFPRQRERWGRRD